MCNEIVTLLMSYYVCSQKTCHEVAWSQQSSFVNIAENKNPIQQSTKETQDNKSEKNSPF